MLPPNLVCRFLQIFGYTFGFKSKVFDEEICEAGNEEVYILLLGTWVDSG